MVIAVPLRPRPSSPISLVEWLRWGRPWVASQGHGTNRYRKESPTRLTLAVLVDNAIDDTPGKELAQPHIHFPLPCLSRRHLVRYALARLSLSTRQLHPRKGRHDSGPV